MAHIQLTRQRQKYATTTISNVQSVQLVQTMLHGALSTLTWLRELFPEKAFVDRYYEMRESPLPYADFAAARMPSTKDQADPHSTRVPILLRKRSKRADIFLDWLEKAVFPELESGDLRAIQLLIHPDKTSRDSVLETYTFTVHYSTGEGGQRTPSGLTANIAQNEAATNGATNTALQQLLRNVSSLCQELPMLPADRLLSMVLVYDCEKGHPKKVTGFVPCEDSDLLFGDPEGWCIHAESIDFTTGHHDTILRITGLQHERLSQTGQTQNLPSDMEFSRVISRYADIQAMPPPPSPGKVGSPYKQMEYNKNHIPTTGSADIHDDNGRSSLLHNMKYDLINMMQPEQITQGDTQTQSYSQQPAVEDAVTVTPTSGRAPSIESTYRQTPVTTDTFPLLADTQRAITSRKEYLAQTASALARKAGGRTEAGKMVLCQCGFGKDEGDMVQCSYCLTWQHLHCYGYIDAEDPRLPNDHVCYWCLLGDTDVDNYKALQELAVQRRAMFHVARSGLRTKTDLSKSLGIEQDQASELHTMIKKSAFVTSAARSHKPGYRATGKALFVPVQDDATIRRLLEAYFDPMAHVSHHYDAPSDKTSIERNAQINIHLIKALGVDLPMPATPHRGRKKSKTPTNSETLLDKTLSASDLPTSQAWEATSETLQNTPTTRSRARVRSNKRALDIDDAGASNSKKLDKSATSRRQYISLQSSRMIDANQSSSPYPQQ